MLDVSAEPTDAAPKIQFFREIFAPAIFAYLSLIGLAFVLAVVLAIVWTVQGDTPASVKKHFELMAGSFYGVQLSSLVLYGAVYVFAELRALDIGRASLLTLYAPMGARRLVKFAGAGILGAFLVLAAIILWSNVTASTLSPTPSESRLVPGARGSFDAYKFLRIIVSAFSVGLVAPFVEEVFFRGLVQRWLAQRLSGGAAILASATIFALFHFKIALHFNSWGVFLTLGIGSLGAAAGYLFHKHRSLWPGFVLHSSYNLTLIAISLLGPR